jgi:hypothetical protein
MAEVVDQINDEYREEPNQGAIQSQGNAYLEVCVHTQTHTHKHTHTHTHTHTQLLVHTLTPRMQDMRATHRQTDPPLQTQNTQTHTQLADANHTNKRTLQSKFVTDCSVRFCGVCSRPKHTHTHMRSRFPPKTHAHAHCRVSSRG